MPEPTVSQGHVDQMLTNISVAFMQDPADFIADKVFPTVPVAKSSDFYWKWPKEAFLSDEVGPRPMGGYPNVVGHKMDKDTYYAEEEALEARLDDRERANATPPYDPERGKVRLLTSQHLIHRDKRFAANYFKTTVWGTDITGVASSPSTGQTLQWNVSTSNPSKTIRKDKRKVKSVTGFEPNVFLFGSDVEQELLQNPDLIDRTKYTGNGAVALDLAVVAQYLGVDRVLPATAIANTAKEGATAAYSFIVGAKDALLVYAAPEPGIEVPSGGYIFTWTGLLGGNAYTPAAVWRGRDERAHTDWFQVRTAYAMKVVAPELGVFYSGLVA